MTTDEKADSIRKNFDLITNELSKVIVGQTSLIQQILICLLCGGHGLIEGVPGLGKTLIVKSLGQVLNLEYSRIQFTPDLMPADILGTNIVNQDEREAGERRKLNFGHTIGHAVEKSMGISHGAAVSIGMVLAAELSKEKGLLKNVELERLKKLLERLGLPTRIDFVPAAVIEALGKDKKRESDQIKFVLLDGLGKSVIEDISMAELKQWVHPNP